MTTTDDRSGIYKYSLQRWTCAIPPHFTVQPIGRHHNTNHNSLTVSFHVALPIVPSSEIHHLRGLYGINAVINPLVFTLGSTSTLFPKATARSDRTVLNPGL